MNRADKLKRAINRAMLRMIVPMLLVQVAVLFVAFYAVSQWQWWTAPVVLVSLFVGWCARVVLVTAGKEVLKAMREVQQLKAETETNVA